MQLNDPDRDPIIHNGPAELAALAIGFLVQIQTDKFYFITVFLNHLLHLMEPVNKQLQAVDALDVPAVTRMIYAALYAVRAEWRANNAK